MSYSKREILKVKQSVRTGVVVATPLLDADNPGPVSIELGDTFSKLSYQSSGDLVCTVEFSIDGLTWTTPAAVTTALASFNTHNVTKVRIIRSSGSGFVSIAGK